MSAILPTPMQPKPQKAKNQRKGLRRMSNKRELESRGYMSFKAFLIRERVYCEFNTCMACAEDLHHVFGRNGGNLMNPVTIRVLCRRHHQFIHDNARWARANGWLR